MKKITLIFLCLIFLVELSAQTTFSWRNDQNPTSGLWNNSNYWWNGSSATLPSGGEILFLDGSSQTSMTNDLPSTNRYRIIFGSGGSSRTINGTTENTFYDYGSSKPKIENNSSNLQTISFPLKWGYGVVELNPVNGDLTVTSTINNNANWTDVYGDGVNNRTLTLANLSGSGGLSLKTANTTIITNGACTFTGNTFVDLGTLELGADFSSATITVASGATLRINAADVDVQNLTINTGGTVIVEAAKQLTINGTFTNNGTLTLKSAQNIGTATVITTGTVDGSGTTTVEQFVSSAGIGAAGRNWYISSPLSAATSSTISTETGNDLVYWNGTAWTAAGTTMDVMKGYIAVSPSTNKTIQFTGGSLNTGSQSVTNLPLGFNLVGNPYPSYVDFTNATKTNVTNSIWYRSKSSGSYVFQTYNVPSNIGLNDGTAIIPPLQSFWIKTTSTTNTFGFDNTMRSHQDQSIATNRLKIPAPVRKLARLEIAAGTDKDETVVYFYQNAQNTFDDYDSQKMFNEEAGAPEIYTFTDAKNLAINGQATIQLDTEIPIGFRTGLTTEGQNYSLKATQIQNFASDVEMVLVDKDNSNAETIMNEGTEYTFTSTPVNTTNRFSLVFRSKGTTTGGFGALNNKMRIQKNATNQLVVICDNNALKNASVTVYSAAGQKITEQMISGSNTVINVAFKAGVYVVKLQSEGKNYNTKVSF